MDKTGRRKFTFKGQPKGEFEKEVFQKVEAYFTEKGISKKANTFFYVKGITSFLLVVASYVAIYLVPPSATNLLLCYTAFGFFSAATVFNLAHDAMHASISTNPRINQVCGYAWNMVGISSRLWKLNHNFSHHTFTNAPGVDHGVEQGPLLRLDPTNPWRKHHRYQHIYGPILMCFITLQKIFVKDFAGLKDTQFGNKTAHHTRGQIIRIILLKVFFVFYLLVLPLIFVKASAGLIVFAFFCYNLIVGAFVAATLITPHYQPEIHFALPDEQGIFHTNWFDHQLGTTVDFSIATPAVSLVTGGLNHHVIHHFFPTICHCHFAPLTQILKETAKAHGKPYIHKSWIKMAVDCYRFLRIMGKGDQDAAYLV